MTFNASELAEFKQLLQQRAEALVGGAGDTREHMNDSNALFADPLDRATLESNRNFTLRLRDRERMLARKIQEALQRIETGTFGMCEECGEPIERGRLLARPVTTLCIDCKEEEERLEKMEL